ncbi:MAG: hypothetical protein JW863_06705 [Chitinispirillaceae bacterium]|nr:hypothetical protein [Chitinispirillaceae bacterium]
MTSLFSDAIRSVVILMVVYLLSAPCAVHAEEQYSRNEITEKISSYKRLQTGGGIMLIGGIALDVAGTIALVHGVHQYNTSGAFEMQLGGVGWVLLGGIGMLCGALTTTGGIVMISVGKRKMEEYQRKPGTVSLGVQPGGLTLNIQF